MGLTGGTARSLPVDHNVSVLQEEHQMEEHMALQGHPLNMSWQHNLTVAWGHHIPLVGGSPGHSQGIRRDPRLMAVYGPVYELVVDGGPAAFRSYVFVLIVEQVGFRGFDMMMPGDVKPIQMVRFPPKFRHPVDHLDRNCHYLRP